VLGDTDPTGGVIIVRIWWEEGIPTAKMRGRVTSTPRIASTESVSTPVSDVESVLAAVKTGVEAFLAIPLPAADG
jgi:hypothetical protein